MTKIGVKDESSIPGGRIRLKLSHINLDCHEEDTGYTPLIIAVLNGKTGLESLGSLFKCGSVRVAKRLALPTSDHEVAGSNPTGGEILHEPKWCFIAQSLSCSLFHRPDMTEILLTP